MGQLLDQLLPSLLHLQTITHLFLNVLEELLSLAVLCVVHSLCDVHGQRGDLLSQLVQLV